MTWPPPPPNCSRLTRVYCTMASKAPQIRWPWRCKTFRKLASYSWQPDGDQWGFGSVNVCTAKAEKSDLSFVSLFRFKWYSSAWDRDIDRAIGHQDTKGAPSVVLGDNVWPGTCETHCDGSGNSLLKMSCLTNKGQWWCSERAWCIFPLVSLSLLPTPLLFLCCHALWPEGREVMFSDSSSLSQFCVLGDISSLISCIQGRDYICVCVQWLFNDAVSLGCGCGCGGVSQTSVPSPHEFLKEHENLRQKRYTEYWC
jgi:hypothetical protein